MTPAVFDITIFLVLFLSTVLACWRGLVREVFTILGLGVSAIGAWKGGPFLIPIFNDLLGVKKDGGEKAAEAVSKGMNADAASQPAIEAAHAKADLILGIISPSLFAKLCAYGTAFLVVFLVMTLISFFVTRSVQEMGLGLFDRLGGAIFGFARGFMMVFLPYVICFIVAGRSVDNFPDWAKNSYSVPMLSDAFDYADKRVDIGKFVQDHGGSLVVKVDKDAFSDEKTDAEKDLQEAITREEEERDPPE